MTFKIWFGDPQHAEGNEHRHIQQFHLLRATGDDARRGLGGEELVVGDSGEVVSKAGIRVYAGLAPDLFAGDAVATRAFMGAFFGEKKYNPDAFLNRQNFFDRRNASAIVLEIPNKLIGNGKVHAWATASLVGHAPEVQVSRWGLPLLTHLFLADPANSDLAEKYNRTMPSEDLIHFAEPIAAFAEKMVSYANSSAHPAEYGKRLAARLCPTNLPYEIGTIASFNFTSLNGRGLADDVMDVILTLATNKPLGVGISPDRRRIRSEFPYFGDPFTAAEQQGVPPAAHPTKK